MPRRTITGVSQREQRILNRVAAIPEGFVATYGDCSPGAPRMAGAVLKRHGAGVPWWRVVRADGSLAKTDRQRALLDAEGIPFSGTRVDLASCRIDPEDTL